MKRFARRAAALLGASCAGLSIAGGPVQAQGQALDHPQLPTQEQSPLAQSFAELQQRDAQLFDAGWRIARANAPFCERTQQSIGLQLQDLATLGPNADAIRGLLGVQGDFAVKAVARGSPAQIADITPNLEVRSLDGVALESLPQDQGRAWLRLQQVTDSMEAALRRDGSIELQWRGGEGAERTAIIAGKPICASRFEVLSKGRKASADGARVLLGRSFAGFDYAEDEFAAAVAHELAHNLLSHQDWLEREGRSRKNIRTTEREADRLMPWLLANAGYDPGAANRFMARWGPRHGGGLLRKRTHDGWDERIEFITAELALIQQLMAESGAADWRQHFRRSTAP